MKDPQDRDTTTSVGRVIGGKFKLLRLIGRGGMGAVYEAENTWTKRRVATKILRPEYAADRDALRRFMQEAQSASQIAHPNIIDVLDLGLDPEDGSLYMVQELLTGIDLRRRLVDAPTGLSVAETFEVMVPIMAALVSAHARGVVHRDLKPENIFLCRGVGAAVVPKLIDFGVSKVLDAVAEKGHETGVGTAIGTPRYMSPEQIRADAAIDGRSDVWAIGVVLYEMLTGQNPFTAASSFLSVNRVLHEEVPRLEVVRAELPAAIAELVHQALERDVGRRHAGMRAFLEAVFACDALDRGLEARHRGSLRYLDSAAVTMTDRPEPAQFSLITQLTPPTQQTLPVPGIALAPTIEAAAAPAVSIVEAPKRTWGIWVVGVALAAALGALYLRGRVPTPSTPVAPVVIAPPAAPPVVREEPSAPRPAPSKRTRDLVRPPSRKPSPTAPVPHEEGVNRAPIVE